MNIFSGTSNTPLAREIAKTLGVTLGDVEITRFIDNECKVFVKEDVAGEDIYVVQSLSEVADQHLVELCLLGSALKDLGAKTVTAVIPWMGYSKQDKAFRKGEAISAQLVARFIESAGFDRVITCELHSRNVLQYFRIPVTELSTHALLVDTLSQQSRLSLEHMVVVSPDKGGASRSERFAGLIHAQIAYLSKSRDVVTGMVSVSGLEGDVAGKTVVMFDDIINTGSTAVKTSEFVNARGASAVWFLATHAVLAGDAAQVLSQSVIERVIVTDTIAIPDNRKFAKLSVVSVASLFADAITGQTK